jgi:predicted  nucleic acid-binding Zn-ribbon protein
MFLLKQDDCGIKLNIIKNKINSVKNNKEYKALLKEQDLCLSLNNKIDNEILAIMEKVEQLNSEIKNMESKFEDINKKLKIVDSEKKNISDDFRNKKSKLLILRDKIVSKILPRHFEKYEFKMKKMNRPPLFEISGEICPFCGFEISQALKNSIVSLDGINLCNECGVILYWAGASESRKCDFCAKFVDTEDLIDAIISEKKFVCSRCKNETDIFKG